MAERAILSLGSNVGDRERYLEQAVELLVKDGSIQVVVGSPIYETQPVGLPTAQADYLNQVIVITTELTAQGLLAVCQGVEESLGRPGNHTAAAPRTIDIDIITYGNLIHSSEELILPHPRYTKRKFVLVPLADIEPTFHDPVTGRSIQQLVEGCPDTSSIERWDQVGSAVC